jgi:hypothetical protein
MVEVLEIPIKQEMLSHSLAKWSSLADSSHGQFNSKSDQIL